MGSGQVDAAKADGRWDRAYRSGKGMRIPDDLQAAIDAEPKAREMLGKLSEQNRFALAFRIHNMKTEAGRKKKIRGLRRDARARRYDLPAEEKMSLSANENPEFRPVSRPCAPPRVAYL